MNEEIEQRKAPLETIEELLKAFPDAAMQVCHTNTYSPLAYACFVVEKDCDLVDAEAIVRLLIKYCPECTKVTTSGSLSALDIHIVSYSQNHQDVVEENPYSGRTNTGVLRTLLEHDPSLARVRIARDKVSGAVELLYRSNANAFLEVVSLDDIKKKTKRRSNGDYDDSKAVISEVTKWWVWRWVILLLKYGTLPHKKEERRFYALRNCLCRTSFSYVLLQIAWLSTGDKPATLKALLGCASAIEGGARRPGSLVSWRFSTAKPTMLDGVGYGVAVPHARIPEVENFVLALGIAPDGVNWESEIDDQTRETRLHDRLVRTTRHRRLI
jgi:hypothetical protein